MKHAYLIIAHNEFAVLDVLLKLLDEVHNDIYIHFDKKVISTPALKMNAAKLTVLKDRIDVRWGHVSQIETMLLLLKKATEAGVYSHLHLISGVHMPVMRADNIREYFSRKKGFSVLNKMETSDAEINLKIKHYNIFVRSFKHTNSWIEKCSQFFWMAGHKMQKFLCIRRVKTDTILKASQWVSLSQEASEYLVKSSASFLKKYKYTFCGDEFFIPTELNNSHLREKVLFDDKLLKCEFVGAGPRVYTLADFQNIVASNCIFARKFSHEHMDVVHKIEKILKE